MKGWLWMVVCAALAAGCGGADGAQPAGTLKAPSTPAGTAAGTAGGGAAEPTPDHPKNVPLKLAVEVWFTKDEALAPVTRTVSPTGGAVGAAALEALLAGPTAAERGDGLGTVVPAGTRLLGLDIDDGVATVDLTGEYESGGGSLAVTMRLAQVVYTLTQFPTVDGVRFHLDGEPVNVFSGEGVVLERPLGRRDYADLLPAITVALPVATQEVSSPVTVRGEANVFEANVTVVVLDADGREVGREFTTATCGTGCRGDYTLQVPFSVASEQAGTVVVQDDDADGDGQPSHAVRVPVTLLPG